MNVRIYHGGTYYAMKGLIREIGQMEVISDGPISLDLEFAINGAVERASEPAGPTLEQRALEFATRAHGDQKRKYDGRPYIYHPIAVAEIVRNFGGDDAQIAAALLHDVVEDTDVTIEQIRAEFGDDVGDLVADLTDVSKPEDGNRKIRKQMDLEHTAKASPRAKTVKLADVIDNDKSIKDNDPDFYRVWNHEKARLLDVLKDGNPKLWNIAFETLN